MAQYLNEAISETTGSAVGSRLKFFQALTASRLREACIDGATEQVTKLLANWKAMAANESAVAHVRDTINEAAASPLHLIALQAVSGAPSAISTLNVLLDDVAVNVMEPEAQLKSPLLLTLEALDEQFNLSRGEGFAAVAAAAAVSKGGDGLKAIRALLRKGADGAELTDSCRSVLHLCAASTLAVCNALTYQQPTNQPASQPIATTSTNQSMPFRWC
jgi:hypothetical protein